MCYSQELSLVFALGGWLMTVWQVRRTYFFPSGGRKPGASAPMLTAIWLFYAVMETVQFLQYFWLDDCQHPANIYLTYVAYGLVLVQPMLWNRLRIIQSRAVSHISGDFDYEYMPIFYFAERLGMFWAVCHIVRLWASSWETLDGVRPLSGDSLTAIESMVGPNVCTLRGPSHLYWQLPLRSFYGFEPNFWAYLVIWFMPALYERKHPVLKFCLWVSQILLVYWTTTNVHEWPSVWCALSVPILLLNLGLHYAAPQRRYKKI